MYTLTPSHAPSHPHTLTTLTGTPGLTHPHTLTPSHSIPLLLLLTASKASRHILVLVDYYC
jgi:hypothetical protein